MTLEELKLKMLERGCQPVQVNAKVVAIVLDILADSGTAFIDAHEAEKRLAVKTQEAEAKLFAARTNLIKEQNNLELRITEYEKMRKATEASFAGTKAYIKDWYEAIKATETAEGRDTMRKAQFYINEVKTIAAPAAYAEGLARILSSGESFTMNRMQKA